MGTQMHPRFRIWRRTLSFPRRSLHFEIPNLAEILVRPCFRSGAGRTCRRSSPPSSAVPPQPRSPRIAPSSSTSSPQAGSAPLRAAPSSSPKSPRPGPASAAAADGSLSPSSSTTSTVCSASSTPSLPPRSSCRRSSTTPVLSPRSSSRPTPPRMTSRPPPSVTSTGSPMSPRGLGDGPSSTLSTSPPETSSSISSTMEMVWSTASLGLEMSTCSACPGDQLIDLLYHGNGMVCCLTRFGDVHVLRLPRRRRREPIILECHTPTHYPVVHNKRIFQMHGTGPDLNVRVIVEPLLSSVGKPVFDAATCFTQPYIPVSIFTSAKNLVFCNGNLYQIWRNATCTVTLQLPGGGRRRVLEDEIFVMRYAPRRRPCWDAVSDLGGYSVFVGRNNAVTMHAEGVPGLMGDCVYWIGGRRRDQGMVFNMKTGRSTPCLPPLDGIVLGSPQSTICWYFLSDTVNNGNNTNERGVYRTRARSRAESGKK